MDAGGGPRQWVHGEGNVVISHVADSQISVVLGGDDRPRDVGLRPGRWELPAALGPVSLATLLKADVGVVPFADVGGRLEKLLAWADGDDPIAVTVVAGPVGSGKTRLGGELCRLLTERPEDGWLAGFLRHDAQPDEVEVLAAAAVPRLVVIDYSEAKADAAANVVSRLSTAAADTAPVRVVLLTRATIDGSHDVRGLLRGRSTVLDALLDRAELFELTLPQWSDPAVKQELFTAAGVAIAARLGQEPPEPPEQLASGVFDRPLTIALAAGLACHDERALPTERRVLLDRLLEVEAGHWRRTAERLRLQAPDTLLREIAGYAALAGAASDTEAAELLTRLPKLADAQGERRYALAEWVHQAYPGPRYWNPVEPDLVGEHLIATTIGAQDAVVDAALAGRDASALQKPVELLGRALGNYPDLAATWSGVVDRRLDALVDAARAQAESTVADALFESTLADALALVLAQVEIDVASLAQASSRIPSRSIVLNPLQVAIYQRLVDQGRDLAGTDPAVYLRVLATNLSNLSVRLGDVRRDDEGLAAAEEAVAICRRLADADPPAHLPDLAASLSNLSVRLGELGRRDEGLAVVEEAVAICRRLGADDPDAHLPDLAISLHNLSIRLGEAGRRAEALAAIEEAVTIRRRLADADPAAYLPDLAVSLSNLSVDLGDAGRRDEGLAAVEEAVAVHRWLADANPAAYLPDLAGSLINLSNRLGELGRRAEALAAIEEATAIRRRLADADPAAYLPDLAVSLSNLSIRLGDVGRGDEGLAAAEESVAIRRQLADSNPAAHLPDLAGSLNNLSNRLGRAGHHDEALAAVEEAAAILRQLAGANPAAFLPSLAASLNNLSVWLGDVGRSDEGLAAVEEAAAIRRQLADANPAAYLPDLAGSLNNLSLDLGEAGRIEEALDAVEEAVAVYRRLVDTNPAAYLPDLATGLRNLSVRLGGLERHDEALTAIEESAAIRRQLAEAHPAAFLADLVRTLGELANRLEAVGRHDEAQGVRDEATQLAGRPA